MKKCGKYENHPEGTAKKQPEVKSMLLQTYLTSLLCLVLCVTMFFGTSYAWFTSEVQNVGNEIYIGTLDVDLRLKQIDANDQSKEVWTSLKGTNAPKIFTSDVKWEPGYTALETLQVVNQGDLTFNYELKFISEDETLNADVAGLFEVYVCNASDKSTEASNIREIKEDTTNWKYIGTLDEILTKGTSVFEGTMITVGEAETTETTETAKKWNESGTDTYIIAVHMKEEATVDVNEANIMGKMLKLNVKLIAYQRSGNGSETDGFGNSDYDDVTYVSNAQELQTALNDATGTTTITLATNIEDDVTVTQKEDVNITIDGNGNTLAGTITVDGKSAAYDTAALTIQNVNFVADSISADAYIRLGNGDTATRYTNHVTVQSCTFAGDGIVAIKSYTGGDKNLTITGCTVSSNMHSLLQVANVEEGLQITDCKVYSKNGANLNNTNSLVMNGCTFDVRGYAVRFGVDGNANTTSKNFTIENCTLKSACEGGDAVIVFRGSSVYATLHLTNTTLEGTKEINGDTDVTTITKN